MVARSGLDRRAVVAALLRERGRLLVVAGLGSPAYDAFAAGDHDGAFYLWAAMGGAAMVGLGLAQAQPDRPVLLLTSDGEQLMGLGALATIGVARPGNLTVVALDNGHYGETGMQPSHTSHSVALAAVARGCGFADATTIDTMAGVEGLRAVVHRAKGGPRFATAVIGAEPLPRALPPRDGVLLKNRLRAHLGLPVV
ncbi:MAG: aldehyde dehydrogenase [Alphaproteobacteria bacterium]|nr:aldehyde dehydrogenase [Alphaproteobacteria bacterium]